MKIGIYGGSFNPPHLGHQNAAVEAAEKCALDKLLLIPAGIPPHKVMEQGSPANEHRLAMTRLMGGQAALQSGVEVEVLDLEMAREGKSYTIDTLRALRRQYPNDELLLFMGTDMFFSFESWRAPRSQSSRKLLLSTATRMTAPRSLPRRQRSSVRASAAALKRSRSTA